ncbi:MAG TPA: hypothetical protein VL500_02130 [Candidatus Eisenbacteria bacterium]|jgi:hypothetical protein|nr:hypothetical protein [Candidatus Eisenbacteria bacterium]
MHPIMFIAAFIAIAAATVGLIRAGKRGASKGKGELLGTRKFFDVLMRARPAALTVTSVDWPTGNEPPNHRTIRYLLRFEAQDGAFRTWFDPGQRRSFPPQVEKGYHSLIKNVRWCRGCKDHGDGRHGRIARPAQVADGLDLESV